MYSNSTYQYTYYIDVHVGRAIDYNYRYYIKVPYLSLLTFTLQQTELTAMCMLHFMTGILWVFVFETVDVGVEWKWKLDFVILFYFLFLVVIFVCLCCVLSCGLCYG